MTNFPPSSSQHEHGEFSLPRFTLAVLVTLAGLFGALRLIAPTVWSAQFITPLWKAGVAFAAVSLLNCFIEYFFHR